MSDDGEQAFRERFGGVSGEEIVGLLATIMRPEFYKHTTSNGNKRVRRWVGNLLGVDVAVTEVGMGGEWCRSYDYNVDNLEWEMRFRLEKYNSIFTPKSKVHGSGSLKGTKVILTYPNFEGDVDQYRHDMTMIRMMGLDREDQGGDLMAPKLEL